MVPAFNLSNVEHFNKALSKGHKLSFSPVELCGEDLAFYNILVVQQVFQRCDVNAQKYGGKFRAS